MDKAELSTIIQSIGTCESEADRREMLTSLEDNLGEIFDTNKELTDRCSSLQNDNESLRSANMKLFLRIGEQRTETEITKDLTGTSQEEPVVKKDFKDLFNEKGGLK
jgi:regulator of replication initiation timing